MPILSRTDSPQSKGGASWLDGPERRVGMNPQGEALAQGIMRSGNARIHLLEFIDDRIGDRCSHKGHFKVDGKIDELSAFVKKNRVQSNCLSLLMASRPRILQVLDGLKDTTASIDVVPCMFITDLIQGRSDSVCGVP